MELRKNRRRTISSAALNSRRPTNKVKIDAAKKFALIVDKTRYHNNVQAKLERVFGTTACSSSLSVDPRSGLVAYPAGSIIVLLNPQTLSQAHLICASKNQLTSLAFSPSGRYLVTGEFGADPKVRVWELRHEGNTHGEQRVELAYHKLGISCVSFTKDSDQVISVGNQHDKSVCVWDWRTQTKLAESRLTCQVNAMDVSESGRMFVTVGVRHVKFWYLEQSGNQQGQSMLLQGRSAILADQRNNTFVDVCCVPNNRTFSITISKLLVEFMDKKLVNIYELGGEVPFSLSLGAPNLLFMGFGNGAIRAMDLERMEPELELGRPHTLHYDISRRPSSPDPSGQLHKHPDVHSLVFHPSSNVLTALYSDRSIYHWHVQPSAPSSSPLKIQNLKLSSQLFHVGPVFDIEACNSQSRIFFTAGADETVRVWFLKDNTVGSSSPSSSPLSTIEPNHYSLELRKILYLSAGIDSLSEQPDKNFGGILSDTLDSTTGVRCIKLSSDGMHLACGTRNGNICVFDVNTYEMSKLVELEAHDSEVLCLEYNYPSAAPDQLHLLASGSRDRLIHLFDASCLYTHLLTIDDHSSSVSALKFNHSSDPMELITFGTDKLIVVRQLSITTSKVSDPQHPKSLSSRRLTQIVSSHGPNCMTVTREGNVLAGCQDRQLRLYNEAGKLLKTVKGTVCEEGTITKFCLDPSESFAATICSDRFVYIMDLSSGQCVAVLNGQSDCVTGISFSSDCKRLLLVSYSGCVLVWRLSLNLTRRMHAKLAQIRHDAGDRSTPDSLGSNDSSPTHSAADEFGSLTSLNICCQTTTEVQQQQRQEDDELDSGIGGGGGRRSGQAGAGPEGGAAAQRSTFELKRVVPSDAIIRRSSSNLQRRLSIGECPENLTRSVASPPPAPQTSTDHMQQLYPSPATAPHRPQGAPPSYHSIVANSHNQQQHSPAGVTLGIPVNNGSSRSMSNLHSAHRMLSPPQRNAPATGGRRRWNVPVNGGTPPHPPVDGNDVAQKLPNYISPPHRQQPHQFPHPMQPSPLANHAHQPPAMHQNNPNTLTHRHQPQQYFVPNQMQQQQQIGLGMSCSVSMNALRTMLVGGGDGDCGNNPNEFGQGFSNPFYETPSPFPTSSLENSPIDNGWNRNSLSKRYFQQGKTGGNQQQSPKPTITTTVWSPSVKPMTKHRSSNLFNSSGGASNLGVDKTKTATASSSSNATTPTGDLLNDHNKEQQGQHPPRGGRQYRPKTTHSQGSSSPEPGQKGRMAMSKLKQRRLSTAREDQSCSADGNGVTPFRSRSQSPTHLAMQSLAAHAQHATSSHQHQSHSVKSPSSLCDGLSSPPSSVSRSQRRLSSMNANRLQEARERLKKSQENLAALGHLDEGEGGHVVAGSSSLPRSKSIGNLRFTLARNGPSARRPSAAATADTFSEQQRQMAKSVNDLADEEMETTTNGALPMGESRLVQLSASRQRLAQSIRDMRRMSNSDLTKPEQYQHHHDQPTPPDSAHSLPPPLHLDPMSSSYHSPSSANKRTTLIRRGVQKKLDRHPPRYTGAGTEAKVLTATNPAFGNNQALSFSWKTTNNGQDSPLRSVSSVQHHPSNYLAQKLARGTNSPTSPSSSGGLRSLSIELASAAHSLANTAQMASSPGSKKMALHASECIQEMTRACDKLLGTRQLINTDPAINAEERRQLLVGVNRAISAFRQRLDDAVLSQSPGSVGAGTQEEVEGKGGG